MEWDADKLNIFLHHFGVTINAVSVTTGISKEKLYKLKSGNRENRKLDNMLTAYMNAIKSSKIKELQAMLEYYENFKL